MRVTLRKISMADAGLLVRWRNADAAAFGDSRPLSPADHGGWFRRVYLDDPADHMYVVLAGGLPAGTVGVRLHPDGSREIQRVLLGDKTLARTGVMSAALRAVIGLYGPGRYWLRVLPGNTAAIGFYRRNGFCSAGEMAGFAVMDLTAGARAAA